MDKIIVFSAFLACFAFAMATALPADDLETAQQYYGGWGNGGGWGGNYGGWGGNYGGWGGGGGYGHHHRHHWG